MAQVAQSCQFTMSLIIHTTEVLLGGNTMAHTSYDIMPISGIEAHMPMLSLDRSQHVGAISIGVNILQCFFPILYPFSHKRARLMSICQTMVTF